MAQARKKKLPNKKKKPTTRYSISKDSTAARSFDTDTDTDDVEEDAQDDISSIYYIDDDGTQVDMTTMEQKKGRGLKVLAGFILLVLLGVLGYFGYQMVRAGATNTTGEVTVSIVVEEKVASGDVVTFELQYENTTNVEMVSGDIELFYPEGFQFYSASTDPADSSNRVWTIDTVQPGAGGKISVTGQIVGEKGEKKELSALLTYQPANFSHDFQVSSKATVEITSSIIELESEVPSQVQSGQEFEYKMKYTNTSKLPLHDMKILINYPKGFEFISASSEPLGNARNEWRFDTLDAGETGELIVKGKLDGASGNTKELHFQLGVIELDNSYNVQIEKKSLVVMVNPEITIALEAPELVELGDSVKLTVKIKNTSQAELKNVDVRLTFDGALFTEDDHAFKTIDTILPEEEKKLNYTVNLKTEASGQEYQLEAVANVLSATVAGNQVTFPNQASAIMKAVGSFAAEAQGRYFDEDLIKIGSGPLPPVVGEKTTYVIQWMLNNGANTVKNYHMSTTLPDNVEWAGDEIEGLEYDTNTQTVTYQQKEIEPYTERVVTFMVSVTPTANDVDSLVVLTGETIVSGVDAFTEEEIALQIQRINSNLTDDEGASGKGVVQEAATVKTIQPTTEEEL